MLVGSVSLPAAGAVFGWGTQKPVAATSSELTYEEFKAFAIEIAPRVNLFRDGWREAPTAEYFGGTTRDYLYWLKTQLRRAKAPSELTEILRALRARREIDIREFVMSGSDVDVVVKNGLTLDPEKYGVKKIDRINIARFNPEHPVGQTEIWQGFIPIEKIRLSQKAVFTDSQFGDGVKELFDSKPTVRFASDADFARSYYATLGINHPILLALRYVRIVAMDYKQNHGDRTPTLRDVLAELDRASHDAVTRVVKKSLDGRELATHVTNPKFLEWLDSALKKTGAENTNVKVASLLMDHFGATELPARYPTLQPLMPRRTAVASCKDLFH